MAQNNNMNNVILYKDFDPTLLNFDAVNKNKMGGKSVRVTYGPNKQPVRIQTPALYLPFGVSKYVDEKTGEVSHSVDASFKGMEEDTKISQFYKIIKAIDDRVLQTCVERSAEWLGKTMGPDVISEFYRPLVKPPRDEKYSPLFKIKIVPLPGSKTMPKIFDVKDVHASVDSLDYVTKGSTAKFIVTVPSIWFVNKTFGASSRLFQMVVMSRPISTESFAFEDEEPGEYADDIQGHTFVSEDY
jgi:hypothetical protein